VSIVTVRFEKTATTSSNQRWQITAGVVHPASETRAHDEHHII
jgi:hypothetical protein